MGDTNLDRMGLLHAGLTERIIGEFYNVYNTLGHGFLESIYEEAMVIDLCNVGLQVDRQVPVTVFFRGQAIGTFKADLIVESRIVLELKAARAIDPAHEAQLLNYLRSTSLEVGLLLNFGRRPMFKRFVFANDRKTLQYHRDADGDELAGPDAAERVPVCTVRSGIT